MRIPKSPCAALIQSVLLLPGLLAVALIPVRAQTDENDSSPTSLVRVESTTVWRDPERSAIYFKAKMAIDADGAPDTYHRDDRLGRDNLSNAGRPGHWWALVTDNGRADGEPLLQGRDDPAPGFYISTTALEDKSKANADPARYVNALAIPYIVLPPGAISAGNVRLGDFCVVVNNKNQKICYAIVADIGPANKIGEGSIALAQALGIPSNARTGGAPGNVLYLVFPHSGNGQPRAVREIRAEGARRFKKWGGLSRLLDTSF